MKAIAIFVLTFLAALIMACWIHELGHAFGAWFQGLASIPTPLKAYVLSHDVRWEQEIWILSGGVYGRFIISVCALVWYALKGHGRGEAILAGVLAGPTAYSIRFLLVGRGHDGVEWQAAQTAVGVRPTGHLLDYAFLLVVIAGFVVWIVRRWTTLRLRSFFNLAALMLFGFVALVALQDINNRLFDVHFRGQDSGTGGQPPDLDPR